MSTRDDIIDAVGASNWDEVANEFAGKTLATIQEELDEMFSTDDNGKLANDIYEEVK